MKTSKHTSTTFTPKGVRLDWEPLNEVKPVKLTKSLTTGKFISERELNKRNNNLNSKYKLIP